RRSAHAAGRHLVGSHGLDHLWPGAQHTNRRAGPLRARSRQRPLPRLAKQVPLDALTLLAIALIVTGTLVGGIKAGIGLFLWGIALRVTLGLHATWLVNSATHLYG